MGYMVTGPSEESLRVTRDALVPSKIAVIVKLKPDGTQKVRLVHDLSRSGVNHKVHLPERVVLPRLADVMEQSLRLLRDCTDGMEVKYMVLDFPMPSNNCV